VDPPSRGFTMPQRRWSEPSAARVAARSRPGTAMSRFRQTPPTCSDAADWRGDHGWASDQLTEWPLPEAPGAPDSTISRSFPTPSCLCLLPCPVCPIGGTYLVKQPHRLLHPTDGFLSTSFQRASMTSPPPRMRNTISIANSAVGVSANQLHGCEQLNGPSDGRDSSRPEPTIQGALALGGDAARG
jgi:hypothetical protein